MKSIKTRFSIIKHSVKAKWFFIKGSVALLRIARTWREFVALWIGFLRYYRWQRRFIKKSKRIVVNLATDENLNKLAAVYGYSRLENENDDSFRNRLRENIVAMGGK